MEGQKQKRNPNDLLIFQNIDNEDFEWFYDTINTPLPYYIAVGEVRKLPFYIARHGVEKLIDKLLQKEGKIHTSPIFRDELRKKIVLGLEQINYIREKTPNELALEALKRKKETDPYDELLKEREVEAERRQQEQIAHAQPAAPLKSVVGRPVEPIAPQVSNPVSPVVPTDTALNNIHAPEIVADPERIRVYGLLNTKLHLDLSHKQTKEKLDSMTVDALKSEFSNDLPELANPNVAVNPDLKEAEEDKMPSPAQAGSLPPPPPAAPQYVVQAPQQAVPAGVPPLLDQQLKSV